MIAIAAVGQVASGGMGVVVGVVLFLGITSWLWLPALGRRLRRAWELQIEALRGTIGSAGLDGPEDGPSG